jgi:PAS domain S-box-containing protein
VLRALRRRLGGRRLRVAGGAALAAAAGGALLLLLASLGLRLSERMEELRAAPRDNVQWSLSQTEADLLRLVDAARLARLGRAALGEVRLRFDLLYSRADMLRAAPVFETLRADPEAARRIAALGRALEAETGLIDGPDARLRAELDGFAARSRALLEDARRLSLKGLELFSRQSDARRREVRGLILAIALLAGALIVLLAGTIAITLRQFSLSLRRAGRIERAQARLSAMVDASLDAIVVVDHAGAVVEFNEAAESIFGLRREAALGRDMAEMMIPPRLRAAHRGAFRRHLETGAKSVLDGGRVRMAAVRADGAEFPAELSIGSSVGEDGPIFIGFLRDISRRVAAETELTRARDEARAAERAKSEFIAVMSHEMRTPLNGLLGTLDLLLRSALEPRQRRYAETARRSAEILLHHVGEVLDIARIESGRVEFAARPFDPAQLLEDAAEVQRAAAEAAGVRLEVSCEGGGGPVLGDPERLQQVVLNLLGNAVKFTPGGRVRLSAQAREEAPGRVRLDFAVADDGPGIAQADQARIFDDFVTLEAGYGRRESGTGLGLAICRRLVAGMGGEIGVESAPGRGSVFRVSLRLDRADPAAAEEGAGCGPASAAASAPARGRRLRVLVVEDNEVNRFVAGEMLAGAGHAAEMARDGREGVARADGAAFDLILMDIGMPGMDGVAAARAIRAGDGPNRATPIFGLTAHAGVEEQARFRQAGMDRCLVKPIRIEALETALADLGAGRADAAPEPGETPDGVIDAEVLDALSAALPPEALERTLDRVCAEAEAAAAELAALAERGETEALAQRAHRLAGSAAIAGAARLRDRLAGIEAAARSGGAEGARQALDGLAEDAAATARVLREFRDGALA